MFQVLNYTLDINHLLHPFKFEENQENSPISKKNRVGAVAFFIFSGILTVGLSTGFYIFTAYQKQELIKKKKLERAVEKVNIFSAKIKSYQEQIPPADPTAALIAHDSIQVGTCQILDRNSNLIQNIEIKRTIVEASINYKAVIQGSDKVVGYIQLYWIRTFKQDTKILYGSEAYLEALDNKKMYDQYGSEDTIGEKLSKIEVKNLETTNNRTSYGNDRYKGLGTILLQIAVEDSFLRGAEGRIITMTSWNSPPFYFKLGLRSLGSLNGLKPSQHDNLLSKEVQKINKSKSHALNEKVKGIWMYIPRNEGIANWVEKIEQNPILDEMKKILEP